MLTHKQFAETIKTLREGHELLKTIPEIKNSYIVNPDTGEKIGICDTAAEQLISELEALVRKIN